MIYIICALAVYKTLQVVLAVLPREVLPWVKVVGGVILSVAAVALAGPDHWIDNSFRSFVLSTLAVATLAGLTHTVIRLLTYLGDWAARKSVGR